MKSHTALRSELSPPGRASRSFCAIRSVPSALVRVTPAGSKVDAAPSRAVSCAIPAERVGVGECALELGVGDRVRVARLAPPGVADGLLAVGVGPAGAVGDQLAVGAEQQVADDLPERVQLGIAGLDQPGTEVVSEPEVGACRLGVAGPGLRAARRVLGGRVPQLVIVEARAGEARVLAGRGRVALVELLVGEVEHERGVDHQMPAAKSGPRSCTNA